MKSIISFILTKTKILRLLAFIAAGWIVGSGVITEEQKPQIGEALAIVLTGAASLLIEKKKEDDTKLLQEDIGAKPDGWAGPQTRNDVSAQTRRGGFMKG